MRYIAIYKVFLSFGRGHWLDLGMSTLRILRCHNNALSRSLNPNPNLSTYAIAAKLARHILAYSNEGCHVASSFWERNGMSSHLLDKFWKRLWARNQARKIITCQWFDSPLSIISWRMDEQDRKVVTFYTLWLSN
jgi:hypothetical protein